ncbi:membrane dipeptidase [Rhodococcus sp. H36-A4]|uniref:membrane dipeptidase n=1 Tax=Rhodococcus sp. H36-A4 TaxID=3004353 RepID=UPI0022AEC055|nr:membrane dipeptidase [Rhodococcus sp. H36-A4]MCZ4080166.1 membrane dipeptidase [Rhodococcus sp. H36-A4]
MTILTRHIRLLSQALAAALAFSLAVTNPVAAQPVVAPEPLLGNSVYGLANGCYALQSGLSGEFIRRGGEGYRADATAAEAEPFRLHAAQLGRFMFYGPEGDLLAHEGKNSVVSTRDALPNTDWTLTHTDGSYRITATGNGNQLTSTDSGLTLTGPGENSDGGQFTVSPTVGCADFPDSEVNATGAPSTATGPNGEVRGFIDTHVHLDASEFMGGNVHCGTPFDPQGITAALQDCPDHGSNGIPALLENILSQGTPFAEHDTTGWPTFADWPAQDSLTHEQTYYKWVERAWRGGLRIFTNMFVANRVLCELYPSKRNPCNEMDTVRIQAEQVRELQDYIDAQYGGPGKGWFRIVRSPEEVRQVAADGKLAVTLGIEVSEMFGCTLRNDKPQCTEADIDEGLDEVYGMGVRQVILTHKFDNAFGGTRFDPGLTGVAVNIGNFLGTGKFWKTEPCTGEAADNPLMSIIPGNLGSMSSALPSGSSGASYPDGPQCNVRGLSALGEHAVEGMMDRGMIVDIDHMSVKTADDTLKLLDAAQYSGVVSGHGWTDPTNVPRIYALGGFVSEYASTPAEFLESWRTYRAQRSDDYYYGFGFGADTNGLGAQVPPRKDAAENPLSYPFTPFDGGTVMDRQRTGERVFDVNIDGAAHYGLIPDWIADTQLVAGADGDQFIEDLSHGAEAYLQMWERVAK